MRRVLKVLAVAAVCALTGCAELNFSVDGLITAPKLTQEQTEIHQALVTAVGNNITLKYPKSGDNRSAYVIKNIDNEPGDEALVFYEYTGDDKKDGLMLNVLDKNDDDEWESVKEIAGAGSEVSKVIISDIGDDRKPQVVVGYTNYTGEEKILEVYDYNDGDLKTIGMDNYSLLETYDVNDDGTDELIVVNKNVTEGKSKSVNYIASLLEVKHGGLFKHKSVQMANNVTAYVNSSMGKLNDELPAIYIDELTNKNELQTEIIYYKYDNLQNPVNAASDLMLTLSTRPVGYYSKDIDQDGIVEIPSVSTMLGYENAVDDEKLYLTSWYEYKDYYELEMKYSGYYSLSDEYVMIFPSRWDGQVTAKVDTDSEEMVFYKYDGDINGDMTELMRIAVVNENDKGEYLYDGYQEVDKKGRIAYMVRIADEKDEPLVPTIDEVKNGFYIVG